MSDETEVTASIASKSEVKEEMQIDRQDNSFSNEDKAQKIKEEPSESGETTDQSIESKESKGKQTRTENKRKRPAKRCRPKFRTRKPKKQRKLSQTNTSTSTSLVEDETPISLDSKVVKTEPDTKPEDNEYVLTVSNLPNVWSYMDIKNFFDTEIEPVDEMELVKADNTGIGAVRLAYQDEALCKSALEKLQGKVVEGKTLSVEMTDVISEKLKKTEHSLDKTLKHLKQKHNRVIKVMQIKQKLHDAKMSYLKSKIKALDSLKKKMKNTMGYKNVLMCLSDSLNTSSRLPFFNSSDALLDYLSSSSSSSTSSMSSLEESREKNKEVKKESVSDEETETESESSSESEEDSDDEISDESIDADKKSDSIVSDTDENTDEDEVSDVFDMSEPEMECPNEYDASELEPLSALKEKLSN